MVVSGFAAQLAQELDVADLRTVLGIFRQDVDRLSLVLAGNAAAGDAAAFRRTCHALAGAAGAVGATSLEQACRRSMKDAGTGLPALHGEITALSAAALDEMARFLATLPPE